MQKLFTYNKINNNLKKREALHYIAFMKFWAMILILRWHLYRWKRRRIDYGARMSEFLFVSSGFLVGYNYYKRAMPATYEASFKYAYKHLRAFYPLHIINSICCAIYLNLKFTLTNCEMLIFNFLLVKAWSKYVSYGMGFNGISWFVSVLLFLYFLSPFLLQGIKSIKNSLIIFIFVAISRLGIGLLIKNGAVNFMDINFHRGPIIKAMDFYLGMLVIPLFLRIKESLDIIQNNICVKCFFTIIQLVFPFVIYIIMLKYRFLDRMYFVFIFVVSIFIIGFDYGYISNIIKKKICKEIMSCQMEMYLSHINLNKILVKIMKNNWPKNNELAFFINCIFIFINAYAYKKLLKDKLAIFMDKIVEHFKKIFD